MICNECPRRCKADRELVRGFCGVGDEITVAKAYLHKWEEPCISGTNGSGTIFFSGCNLRCIYCQNYRISQDYHGKIISSSGLEKIITGLQDKGAHNINLVSPTHYIRQIYNCLKDMSPLKVPVIYNTNGYESMETLALAGEITDVYLPDLKYYSSEVSLKYSGVRDYFEVASRAILKMYEQVGSPVLDEKGIIKKGLIIRHLILPGNTAESINVLRWIKDNLPSDVYISLMSQYTPYHKSSTCPEIDRKLTRYEYEKVVNYFFKLGFENGYVQERDSAEEEYIPDFNFEGLDN